MQKKVYLTKCFTIVFFLHQSLIQDVCTFKIQPLKANIVNKSGESWIVIGARSFMNEPLGLKIRQFTIHYAGLLGRWDKRILDQMFDVPSIIFFHNFLQNSLQKSFQFIFLFFYKITKIKIKSFECPKSIKSVKKMMLGTSDSWSTIHLSHRPSNPA